jgi:hypothetical protein
MDTRGWKLSGGQLEIEPTPPAANALVPIQYNLLCAFESTTPRPVEWQVNTQYLPATPDFSQGFPLPSMQAHAEAGARPLSGAAFLTGSRFGTIVAKIELGGGPNARVIFTDLRPGRYALGAQLFARVSVARWGDTALLPGVFSIQSSIVPSPGDVAGEPATFTFTTEVLQAGFDGGPDPRVADFAIPPGAQWVSVLSNLDIGVRMGGEIFVERQIPSLPTHVPSGQETIQIVNYDTVDSAFVQVTFWVR